MRRPRTYSARESRPAVAHADQTSRRTVHKQYKTALPAEGIGVVIDPAGTMFRPAKRVPDRPPHRVNNASTAVACAK
ncbi:hypothetical protein [Nonomuraea sp. NPDC049625]|uniref:hypothetical protein n=1 Tax=Nonomuraea sp. NPDC049625 TaxID=3155775 RepID=UPI003449DDF9